MKKSEVMRLLTAIAAVERSGWVPTPDDAQLWQAFAVEGDWGSLEVAWRAYVVFRDRGNSYPIKPWDISGVLAEVRREAMSGFNPATEAMPQEAADDPRVYNTWVRQLARERKADAVATFAAGPVPEAAPHAIQAAR